MVCSTPFSNYILIQHKTYACLPETFSIYGPRHGVCILFTVRMLCANILAMDAVGLAFPGNS